MTWRLQVVAEDPEPLGLETEAKMREGDLFRGPDLGMEM